MNTAPSDPLIGRTVGQYDIVAKLGGGGMGVVYRARDTKLGRTVALKFLPPQWSHDEGAKQRFLREAQAASATNHRNICVIHDIGQTDDGQLFIVMAYYEGQTLKQKLESGGLPLAEALEFATELAEGLARAHAQGVVHRDIKPGNIMVTDDGVKILDFGLAKFADALQLTIPGTTVGTVAYMSPEQARGEEADERSDIWALGVVLYEMLTGGVPFKGTYPEAIFYAIKNEPPPPLGATGKEIPEAVERIVLRALEKDPGQRLQSARELARDLRLLQGRTVPLDLRTEALPPVPPARPPGPLPLRRRLLNGLTPARVAVAGAALVAAALGSYVWLTRPVVRMPIAIAPVANHTGEPELDAYRLALTASLVSELGGSPNLRVTPYLRVLEMIRRFVSGADDISGREAIQAISTGSGARFIVVPALAYRDGTWLAQADIRSVDTGTNVGTIETPGVTSSLPKDTAYRLMAPLAAAIQEHFKVEWPRRPAAGRSAGGRFRSLEAAGAFEQGLNAYEKMEYAAALAALQRAVNEDAQRAVAHAWISRVQLLMGQSREAEAAAQRAVQLVTAETPRADALFAAATLAEAHVDARAAEARYRELAALQPDDPVAQSELAGFLKRQGRNQDAVGVYREVLRRDGGYARPHVDLCQIYVQLDDNPLAEGEAGRALEQFRAAGDRGGEAQALLCLGDAQRKQGGARVAEGRRSIESARTLFESLEQPYALCRVYQYLGIVADAERNFPAAARAFEEALTRSRQVGSRTIEGLALMNLGVTYESLGQRARVLQYYEQSRDFYQQIGDERRAAEEETNVAGVLVNYGSNHAEALRRLANARATLRKLGQVEFDAYAMELEALSGIRAGRIAEGRRQLREALSFAKERRLTKRIAALTIAIAQSHFLTNEYDTARGLLEALTAGETERGNWEAVIALGRTYLRLGDFATAAKHLDRALNGITSSGELSLAPLAYEALGELAYESGKLPDARRHFDKAAVLWIDDLPDAASVEARCHRGLIDALGGQASAAASVQAGLEQAAKMGRLHLEVQCRVDLARIQLQRQQYADGLASLNGIPLDGERVIGPELEAEVRDWRARTLAGLNDRARADAEAVQARTLMQKLQASVPEAYRRGFSSRVDVAPLLQ